MPEKKSGFRWAKLAAVLLGLTAAALAAVWAAGFPRAPIRSWELSLDGLDESAVKAAAALAAGPTFMGADAAKIKAAILSDPEVESATVQRRFPDAIRIRARARRPVAVVIMDAPSGGSRAGLLDSAGRLFRLGPGAAVAGLPVLSGMRFVDPFPGMEIADKRILSVLSSLGKLASTGLLAMVSEISVVQGDAGGLELLICSTTSPVRFRARADLDESALKSAALALDVISRGGIAAKVKELDLRADTVVLSTKEGLL